MNDQASWWTPLTLSGPTLTLSPMRLRDAPDYLQALGSAEESAEVVPTSSPVAVIRCT